MKTNLVVAGGCFPRAATVLLASFVVEICLDAFGFLTRGWSSSDEKSESELAIGFVSSFLLLKFKLLLFLFKPLLLVAEKKIRISIIHNQNFSLNYLNRNKF